MDVNKALTDFLEEVQKLKEALNNLNTLKKSVESTENTIREKNAEKKKLIDKLNDPENPQLLKRKTNCAEKSTDSKKT
jgi:archaellum component FlaC